MSYKISKELFEAVMGFCKNEIAEMYVSDENIFWHTYEDEFIGNKDSKINVDTFFFKCKEWAYNKGYIIKTDIAGEWELYNFKNGGIFDAQNSSSEQQACFDACQWILDEDKQ